MEEIYDYIDSFTFNINEADDETNFAKKAVLWKKLVNNLKKYAKVKSKEIKIEMQIEDAEGPKKDALKATLEAAKKQTGAINDRMNELKDKGKFSGAKWNAKKAAIDEKILSLKVKALGNSDADKKRRKELIEKIKDKRKTLSRAEKKLSKLEK
jgi:hypothetical protein